MDLSDIIEQFVQLTPIQSKIGQFAICSITLLGNKTLVKYFFVQLTNCSAKFVQYSMFKMHMFASLVTVFLAKQDLGSAGQNS